MDAGGGSSFIIAPKLTGNLSIRSCEDEGMRLIANCEVRENTMKGNIRLFSCIKGLIDLSIR